jgi:sulfoxide reductase catalytic subunit YedY
MSKIKYSEITPRGLYINRRAFLKLSGIVAAKLPGIVKSPLGTKEPPTAYEEAIRYNNFYEFGAGKSEPAINAGNFRTSPWTLSVEGLVKKPQKLDMNSISALAPLEERIYSLRCDWLSAERSAQEG